MDRHIDYAPALPRYRRKAVRRALAPVLLVAVVLPLGWKAGPPTLQRVRLLYWQRQAMNYTLPPDQVVYDEATGVISFAKPWEHFYQLFSPPGRILAGTLFLHERRNSRGQACLVAVEEFMLVWRTPEIRVCVIRPGGAFTRPIQVTDELQFLGLRSMPSDRVRCYAGQPDPADPSHFTVKCQVKDRSIAVDGWLQDDDTVKLERRR